MNVSMYICVTPLVLMPTAAKEQLAFKEGREVRATIVFHFYCKNGC